MDDIIKRVEKHKKAIAYTFFDDAQDLELCEIVLKKNKRGAKAVLCFEQEKRALYVSGAVFREYAFQKYVTWFNQYINKTDKNYIKNVLLYNRYGFVEYIEDCEWNQRKHNLEFFHKYGEFIALVWSLSGKILLPKSMGQKDEAPVITDTISLLDGEISYREMPEAERIRALMEYFSFEKEELNWIEQGYLKQKEFILKNKADIETLIGLCFKGGEGC